MRDKANCSAPEVAAWEGVLSGLSSGVSIWDSEAGLISFNAAFETLAKPVANSLSLGMPMSEWLGVLSSCLPAGSPQQDAVLSITVNGTGQCEVLFAGAERLQVKAWQVSDRQHAIELTELSASAPNASEKSERRARELVFDAFESFEEGFALWDSDLQFVRCSQKYFEMVFPYRETQMEPGTSADTAIREVYRSGDHVIPAGLAEDDFVEGVLEWVGRREGDPREFFLKSGRIIEARAHQTPLGGLLITTMDVTAERTADSKARDMLFDAFQALDEGLVLCDKDMRYVFGNEAWKKMMFEGREHLIPLPGDDVVANLMQHIQSGFYAIPESMSQQDYARWMMEKMADHGKQQRYRSADGRHFVGSSHLTAYGGALLFIRDVTKQQNSEDLRLAAVNDALDAVDEPLALFASDRTFLLANEAWLEMVKGRADPQSGDTADTIFGRLLDDGFYRLPDDMSKETYLHWVLQMMQMFATDVPLSLADGREHLANCRETALGGFLLSYRDVTDRLAVEAELERQRETAHQNEKLSALGELLAGVAHELNNPLSVVFGYSQMLQGKVADPVTAERIDMICQSAERAAKIVRTFLAMARQRPTANEACAINEIVTTALEISSYSLKTNGTQVDVSLDADEPYVLGDFDQLAQVFSNLLVNGGQAVEDKGAEGVLSIRSWLDAARGEVLIEVADNGPGIPKDIQSRVFEPFFTTKDVGRGTGIGLAFAYRIVASHGGSLTLSTAEGQGTQFFVRLATCSRRDGRDAETALPNGDAKHILVIDDEEAVARLIAELLTSEGHRVSTRTDPRRALELLVHESFDVILSDFKMPNMNGAEFFRTLSTLSPEHTSRIGFVTGDSMGSEVLWFLQSTNRPYIEKPIDKHELMGLVAKCLAP